MRSFNSLYEILHFMAVEMEVFLVFQFSLWDSLQLKPFYCSVNFTFNSLYEIPTNLQNPANRSSLTFNSLYEIQEEEETLKTAEYVTFQFSLWDSDNNILGSATVSNLSILFMRFSKKKLWDRSRPFKLSILFMRFTIIGHAHASTAYKYAFNSLYEIREILSSLNTKDKIFFQFSLWDSTVTPFPLRLPLLYFQFSLWDSNVIVISDIAKRFNFQFSLWDSVGGGRLYHFWKRNFQFSLWDSEKYKCIPLIFYSFQFSLWDSDPLFLFFVLNKLFCSPF